MIPKDPLVQGCDASKVETKVKCLVHKNLL